MRTWSSSRSSRWNLRILILVSILVGGSVVGPSAVAAQESAQPEQPIQPATPRVRNLAQPATLANWYPIGRVPSRVVALAMAGDTLFVVTTGNRLWAATMTRFVQEGELQWDHVLTANGLSGNIVTLASVNIGDTPWLFAATKTNELIARPAYRTDRPWQRAGHANFLVAMTGYDGTLYGATSRDGLWIRPPSTQDVVWDYVGHAIDVVGMAAVSRPSMPDKLFAVTSDNKLWERDPGKRNIPWDRETFRGHGPGNPVAMTAYRGHLLVATSTDDRLWVCAHRRDVALPNHPTTPLPTMQHCGGWGRSAIP